MKRIYGLLAGALMLVACGAPQQESAVTEAADEPENPFSDAKIDYPKPGPVLGFIDAREQVSLNGEWHYIVDPMGVGNPGSIFGGFPKNKQTPTGMELVEYDFEAAPTLKVPGDFNTQKERLFFYQGSVWYYRTFDLPLADDNARHHLHFGGANYTANVFLNGKAIGEHMGGYVPFAFDVTDAVTAGENQLLVRVNNELSADSIPMQRTDWWPYGGLTRDVALVTTPREYIENAKIALVDRQAGTISVRVKLRWFDTPTPVRVSIPELDVAYDLKTRDGRNIAEGTFTAAAELWSPENPKLYDVIIEAGADRVTDRIGFRTIETRGTDILLNGEPIKLRGISTHEEPIGREGVMVSEAETRALLTEAKGLGVNFVRAAHYPYTRHMAKVADEMGLMLWEEVPVYWDIAWENEDTLAIARDQIGRLVERDWNRASVIIWSVANETPLSDARMAFLKTLIDDVRAADDSRLVSAALLGGGRKEFMTIISHLAARGLETGDLSPKDEMIFKAILTGAGDKAPGPNDSYTLMIDDPLGELTDLVGYNEYFGWYYSLVFADQTKVSEAVLRPLMLDFMRDMRIEAVAQKPILISEYGAGAKAGRKGGDALIWTEEYQADVYRAQIEMLRNSPQVQGMTPWILKDFRAMLRPLAGVQDYYNRKGLIDENGNHKLAYDVLKTFYEGEWEE